LAVGFLLSGFGCLPPFPFPLLFVSLPSSSRFWFFLFPSFWFPSLWFLPFPFLPPPFLWWFSFRSS
jgi:hypothetical protein